MSIFKQELETKRLIFNVYLGLAERLEALKSEARFFNKRLDVDSAVNEALDKFVNKAEKKLAAMKREHKDKVHVHPGSPENALDAPGGSFQDDGLETDIQPGDSTTLTLHSKKGATA